MIMKSVKKQNKKISTFVIVITIILIILAIFIIIKLQNRKISCKQDSDCIFVKNECCGCESGGSSVAINKKYQQPWLEKIDREKNCQDIFCTAVYNCPSQPKCIKNKCQIPKINESAESTGIRLGITTPSVELTKGEQKAIQFGVKNVFNKNTMFSFNIYSEEQNNQIKFTYPKDIEIGPGAYTKQEIKINPATDTNSGTYVFILALCENKVEDCKKNSEQIYAFSELTINVS